MRILCLASVFGLVGSAISQSTTADAYFGTESTIAKAGLLANIGPSGAKSSGAKSGIVIASPSTTNPNYLFTWVRDSSLVFKVIIDQFTLGQDPSLRGQIDNFFTAEAALQQVSNPSGTISTGGLAEPKYNIDGTAFTGPWGRPQRDGPALRSTSLITYANWLLGQGNSSFVTNTLWPVIKLDLDYVATYWNQSTFDLWEEINSSSFFTTAVQHRALREGSALATRIGQSASVGTYNTQANNILCFLQTFWNPAAGYITANTGGGRSGKDSNTILASIHTWDIQAGCDATTFQPCSDKALSNLKVYVDSFRSVYPINSGVSATSADVYFNGNPWYLSTFAIAEQLYDAILTWQSVGSIQVTSTSLAFFRQFAPSISTGTYAASSSQYSQLTSAIKTFADGFVEIAAKYTPSNGGLAEQFEKSTGTPLSAADLTWSYASVLTASAAHAGLTPASWGASGLTVPGSCVSNPGPQASVTFNVQATTQFGENIFLSGSVDALENWSSDNALPLSAAAYPVWSITVNVPANTNIQYKYIRKFNGGVTWESDPNNSFNTPASGSVTLNDSWR
ncbi:glucoamylase [Multifurca ochricompacta]|uniref:glucan 1,4-alpha-glucosidase n=1 Tax=Multifurca ochricompacta TaxID=376703 RepID=A0AAD4M7Q7_9AGAM|nr:glucoamylase [Multifurca ochricompacta]